MGCIHAGNSIAKGPVVHYLDELSKGADAVQRLQELRRALVAAGDHAYQDIAMILAEHLFQPFMARSEKLRTYLSDYWFDEGKPTVEFTGFQPIAPAYAAGLIKTIDLSLLEGRNGRPKPIDGWWIVDHPKFEILNLVNEQCVVLLIMTPRPIGIGARGIWNPTAEAWSTVQTSAGGASTERIDNRITKVEQEPATIAAIKPTGVANRP
jgi:hypothetical protein